MIIDGKSIANNILTDLKKKIDTLSIKPKLCVILIGDNPASLSYIKQKERSAKLTGIDFELRQFSVNTTENTLISIIKEINNTRSIHWLIVQLPLPAHINTSVIIGAISPKKDVDGFTSQNIWWLFLGTTSLISCTPKGIMRLLNESNIKISGENIVIIGKSNIVGKPLSLLLMNAGWTVTVCHKETRNLSEFTKNADIIIMAAGCPGLLKKNMIRPGATIVDVGFTIVDGKISGDADFKDIEPLCSITPVPGWVGPMTVAMLMENTYIAAEQQ